MPDFGWFSQSANCSMNLRYLGADDKTPASLVFSFEFIMFMLGFG